MTSIPRKDPIALKRAAAARALDYVQDGMKLGLGTGSTADLFLELLAERIRSGLSIIGTPTSERTADQARRLRIPLAELDTLGRLDLAVDGADEADGNLEPVLRHKDGQPFRTDSGNCIYDCPFGAITNARLLASSLSVIPGVVDHGLFVGMASALVLAGPGGVRVLERN